MKKRTIILVIIIGALMLYGSYLISSGWGTDVSSSDQRVSSSLSQPDSSSGKTDQDDRAITEIEKDGSTGGEEEDLPDRAGINEEREEPVTEESGSERTTSNTREDEAAPEATIVKIQPERGTAEEAVPEEVEEVKRLSLLDQVEEHIVKKGETLWGIAHKYHIDIDTIIGANDITNMNRIKPGDIIRILPIKGIVYKVSPGESLWTIARQFEISLNKIVEANLITDPDLVKPGRILILPGAKPEFGYQERLSQQLMKPVTARISSYYGGRWGRMHEGIDFAVNIGTPIKAAAAGKVIYAGWATGYGKVVIIQHRKGLKTLYAHNSKLLVNNGERVGRGEVISKSGNTGNSTGPHLHFEVQINGKPVNPLSYVK